VVTIIAVLIVFRAADIEVLVAVLKSDQSGNYPLNQTTTRSRSQLAGTGGLFRHDRSYT
jgi:hypothetical protein